VTPTLSLLSPCLVFNKLSVLIRLGPELRLGHKLAVVDALGNSLQAVDVRQARAAVVVVIPRPGAYTRSHFSST
jgi:hypothetical protein